MEQDLAHPRTRRFLRELGAEPLAAVEGDPEVRYWRRVSGWLCAGGMASFFALLAVIGASAAPIA